MFSETRYALNGDLGVAYRASREGARDIVVVPNWLMCCEVLPELPSVRGWVEAMTSLGRLIFFDQPGASRRLAGCGRCRRNNTVATATAIIATTTAAMPILVAAVRDRLSSASACPTVETTLS